MAFSIEITRPDDLLRLEIEGRNVRVYRVADGTRSLVVDDANQPAFLLVHFPPQAIAERAYFEATLSNPGVDEDVPPDRKPQPPQRRGT